MDNNNDIDEILQQILLARYGRDVRQSIHDGIKIINEKVENAIDTIGDLVGSGVIE